MYNQSKLKFIKLIAGILFAAVCFATGYFASSVTTKISSKALTTTQTSIASFTPKKGEQEEKEMESGSTLTEKKVKDFLIAYYTRKDIGENRSRYKPFVTEGLYTEIINQEEEPVNEAYKGYIVDQVFEEGTIYIDKTNQKAIVQISYSNLMLEEKDNREGLATAQEGKSTLRLSYIEEDGKLFVDKMETIVLTDGSEVTASGYNDLK